MKFSIGASEGALEKYEGGGSPRREIRGYSSCGRREKREGRCMTGIMGAGKESAY